jgi:glyoxylase-like metal-dependent hydrolase (beta-lactamase superfamily II)
MRFGDFDLLSLSDGFIRLDGGAMFGIVPKPLWEKRAPADGRNRVRLALRPLLVRTPTATILIDAGVGEALTPKEAEIYGLERAHHLDHSLAEAGLTEASIDIVIASHLHFDHVGGLTIVRDGQVRPRFGRARHIIRRGEWEDATHPHERNRGSYIAKTFTPLLDAGLVDFVETDADVVPGVRVERTGGHTMHHQVIRISSAGRTAIFAADLLPTTAHLDLPWIMGYDLYPVDTLHAKKAFLGAAVAGEYVIFFEHDPAVASGIIRETHGRLHVEPYEGA